MKFLTEHNLLIFLVQFALLLGLSKAAGLLFERFKQSSITGEVLVGLILGPAIFGRYLPQFQSVLFPKDPLQISMLETIAWFGNFYLLMETGLDVNFGRIWKQRGQALTISLTDLIVPMLIAFVPIYLIGDAFLVDPSKRVIFTLFISTIMTISALPVAIRVMYDLNILKSDTGFLIISALTINDLIGWVVFTIILGIFGQSQVDYLTVVRLVVLTLGFTVLSLTLLRRGVDKVMTVIHNRLGADTGLKTSFVFLVGMLFGAATLKIGIHSLFGFFIAGIVLGEAKHFSQNDRHVMNRLVHSVFVPVFFANIGLHLDFVKSFNFGLVALFTVVGIAARFIGAWMGAKLARQAKTEVETIAICHTAGGEMHIVVAILALSSGLITQQIFVGIVVASIISTMVFGPWLSMALKRRRKGILGIVFGKDAILENADFGSKEELLEHMSVLIAKKAHKKTDEVLDAIALREDQMSTAMGRAVAFPHARLEGLKHPIIFVARNRGGIEWDAPDGIPVRWVFFVITPADNPSAQLRILQMLANTLGNKDIRRTMDDAGDATPIWQAIRTHLVDCEECLNPM
jgi:Kef-type K+ transport system membrane component KefB